MINELKELARYFGGLLLAMFANTILGIAQSGIKKEFQWSILLNGLLKYFLIFVGILALAVLGIILPDITIFEFNDKPITLSALLLMIAVVGIGVYSIDAIRKLITLIGLKVSDIVSAIKGETKGIEILEETEEKTE